LLGDLNFRIALSSQEVIQFLQKHKMYMENKKKAQADEIQKYLLSHDELIAVKRTTPLISNYLEWPIDFFPTYKYEPYSNLYDNNRTPSWYNSLSFQGRTA
jgi:hypothetical protein